MPYPLAATHAAMLGSGAKTALAFASAEVGLIDASTVVVTFNRQVAATDAKTGVTITVAGSGATISSGTIQADKRVVYYALAAPVTAGQAVTWAYTGGNIQDYVTSADLATITSKTVTNNVAYVGVDYYVSPAGSDVTGDGSIGSPYKTLAPVNAAAMGGDTTYMRAGTYTTGIAPVNSGSAGNPITYTNYNGEEVVIQGITGDAITLDGKSYITIDGIRVKRVTHYWATLQHSTTHCIITNCYLEEAHGWGGIYIRYASDYNQITNNIIIGRRVQDGTAQGQSANQAYDGPNDCIFIVDASHNLVDGNYISWGTHSGINVQTRTLGATVGNVVRRNILDTPWHHCINVYENGDYTLVEQNILLNAGQDGANLPVSPAGNGQAGDVIPPCAPEDTNGIEVGASYGIYRNNVMAHCGSGFNIQSVVLSGDSGNPVKSLFNRIYNNTHYDNRHGSQTKSGDTLHDNSWLNNIFYNNQRGGDGSHLYGEIYRVVNVAPRNNTYFGNSILNDSDANVVKLEGNARTTLAAVAAANPTEWIGNVTLTPSFVDATNNDFHLGGASAMLAAGVNLTAAVGASTGTSLVVADALPFQDGYSGVVDADWIKVGSGSPVQILSINYATNTITLTASRTWGNGDAVNLYKNSSGTVVLTGAAPNIGALGTGTNSQIAPLYDVAEIGVVNDHTIAMTFSTHIYAADYAAGWAFTVDGSAASISTAIRQTDTTRVYFDIGASVVKGSRITATYTKASGSYANLYGTLLENVAAHTVVNNAPGLFYIGHEANDFSEYTATLLDGGNLATSSAAALNGTSYGMAVTRAGTDNNAYGSKDISLTGKTACSWSFWFDPNTATWGTGTLSVCGLKRESDSYMLARTRVTYSSGYKLTTAYHNDSGTSLAGAAQSIADAPHKVCIKVTRASGNGVSDGIIKTYIDGILVETITGIANYNLFVGVNKAELGVFSSNNGSQISGTYYLDEYVAVDFESDALTSPYTISGTILDGSSAPISGATVTLGSYSTTTGADGTYMITGIPAGYSGNLTPTKTGWTFSPSSTAISAMTVLLTGKNFTGAVVTYTIGGTILVGGSGLASVNVALGAYNANTNGSGVYSITGVPYGTTGSLTPTLAGYTFSPVNIAIGAMVANLTGEDFTGTAVTYTISGKVAHGATNIASATVALGAYNASTAADGTYTITGIPAGTSGTLTCTKTALAFYPLGITVSAMGGNLTSQNYYQTLFQFRMESDLTEWTTNSDATHLTADAAAALNGSSKGMKVNVTSTTAFYVAKTTIGNTSGYLRVRAYFDPNTLTMSTGDEFSVLRIYNSNVDMLMQVNFVKTAGSYQIRFSYGTDSASVDRTPTNITDAPHYVEMYLTKAASTGTFTSWIDGTQIDAVTGLATATKFAQFNLLRAGGVTGLDAGTSGIFYVDEIMVNDSGDPIGA